MKTIKNTVKSRRFIKLKNGLKRALKCHNHNIGLASPYVVKMANFMINDNPMEKRFPYFETISDSRIIFDTIKF